MTDTPNLALPYILAAQSQKHVTHNEAIRALDCLVQISVLDRDLATPPSSPTDGARYIVAASPAGAWTGAAGKLAAFQDGAWQFYPPNEGWLAWVADENVLVAYDGAGWSAVTSGGGGSGMSDHGSLTGLNDDDHPHYHTDARGDARYTPVAPSTLGINATADTTNRLALSSAASLFNHAGSGHQQKINKASSAQTASQLYQSNFSGRAEIGLLGDDDFRFKVSPDGTTFYDAIVIDRNNGRVVFPKSPYRDVLTANRTYYVRTDGNDSNSGLANNAGGAFLTPQKAWNTILTIDLNGFTATIQIGSGTFEGMTCASTPMGGNVTVSGNGAANTTLNTTTRDAAIYLNNCLAKVTITALTLTSSGGSMGGLRCDGPGSIAFVGSGIVFGSNSFADVWAFGGGKIVIPSSYTKSGVSPRHWLAAQGSHIETYGGITATISGTPAFASGFATASGCANISAFGITFAGSATGVRYAVTTNGFINAYGAGANFFPGNAAGTTATGGQYT